MFFYKSLRHQKQKDLTVVSNFFDDITLSEIKKKIVAEKFNVSPLSSIDKEHKNIKILYNQILKNIEKNLNTEHNKNFDSRLIEFIFGKWLYSYISNIFYISRLIKIIKKKYPQVIFVKFTKKESKFSDNDKYFAPFTSNLFINNFFCHIGEFLNVKFIYKDVNFFHKFQSPNFGVKTNKVEPTNLKLINFIKIIFSYLSIKISKLLYKNTIYLHNNIFKSNPKEFLKIILDSKFKFSYLYLPENIKNSKNLPTQKQFNFLINKKKDKNFALNNFEKYIPSAIKELFIILKNKKKQSANSYDQLITKEISVFNIIKFKKFILANFERLKLISLQHGGLYGYEKNLFPEILERSVSNKFISWGWKGKNIISLPVKYDSINSTNVKNLKNKYGNYILFTSWSLHRGCHPGTILSDYYLNYSLKPSLDLVKKMKKFYKIIVRLPPYHLNWREGDFYKKIDNIIIDENKKDYIDLASASQIVIHNHLNTTAIQTLSLNIPTLILIDKKFLNFNNSSKNILKILHSSKILFYDQNEILKFLKSIKFDPETWWLHSKTQKARNLFCKNHAFRSINWKEKWFEKFNI